MSLININGELKSISYCNIYPTTINDDTTFIQIYWDLNKDFYQKSSIYETLESFINLGFNLVSTTSIQSGQYSHFLLFCLTREIKKKEDNIEKPIKNKKRNL